MSIFRTTFQFKSSQGGTWNEVFYVDATTPASAANLGPKLVQARLQMLDPSNTFIGTRAAQVGASRVSVAHQRCGLGRGRLIDLR